MRLLTVTLTAFVSIPDDRTSVEYIERAVQAAIQDGILDGRAHAPAVHTITTQAGALDVTVSISATNLKTP